MYNRRINIDPKARVKAEGGMIRNESTVKLNGSTQSQPIQEKPPEIKVYKRHKLDAGPIASKPKSFSFYDLIVSQDPEDEELRFNGFEDWVFPDIKFPTIEGRQIPTISPIRNIRRGTSRSYDENAITQLTPAEYVQYAYILLNPSKAIIQSFGSLDGMRISRMHYLVCVEVGNPRTGRLDNTFIQYALPLSTPAVDCCKVAVADSNWETSRFDYYYTIQGDNALEQEIFDEWFNTSKYYFNSVIYPRIRGYMGE